MDCKGAPLCGVLVLETGLGSGNYHHDAVAVHGLWPETGSYGSSQCIKPSSSRMDPSKVYSCYEQDGQSKDDLISFETHEWEKHGSCAGVEDAEDFFSQVCGLAREPLQQMAQTKSSGTTDLDEYAKDLRGAGYPVFATDSGNSQVELSCCAGSDGQWVLANTSDFGSKCGA